MSMLDGMSQCWLLSETCAVNWDAWSAVGTCGAVVAALFGPTIHRYFTRARANALFALAYRTSLMSAMDQVKAVRKEFNLDPVADESWAVHSQITKHGMRNQELRVLVAGFAVLSERDTDLTKWVAVDLDLVAKVAVAIESLRDAERATARVVMLAEDEDWQRTMKRFNDVMRRAAEDVISANVAAARAVNRFRVTSRKG